MLNVKINTASECDVLNFINSNDSKKLSAFEADLLYSFDAHSPNLYGAFIDGIIVGLIQVTMDSDITRIEKIMVDYNLRGLGIGKTLIEYFQKKKVL